MPLPIWSLFSVQFFSLCSLKSLSAFGSWIRFLEPWLPLPVIVEPSHGRFPENCPECVMNIRDNKCPLHVTVPPTAETHPRLPVIEGREPKLLP